MLCSHPGASVSPVPVGLVPFAIRKELSNLNKSHGVVLFRNTCTIPSFLPITFPNCLESGFFKSIAYSRPFRGQTPGRFHPILARDCIREKNRGNNSAMIRKMIRGIDGKDSG